MTVLNHTPVTIEQPIETKHEQQTKTNHLTRFTQSLTDQSFDRLSTWINLINKQNQKQADKQSKSNVALQTSTDLDSMTWCPACFASCSIKSNLKLDRLVITCQRPSCGNKTIQPMLTHSRAKQGSLCRQVKEEPMATKPKDPRENNGDMISKRPISEINELTEENKSKNLKTIKNVNQVKDQNVNQEILNKSNQKKSRSRNQNKGKSALAELLAKRKNDQSISNNNSVAKTDLQSFLTQL